MLDRRAHTRPAAWLGVVAAPLLLSSACAHAGPPADQGVTIERAEEIASVYTEARNTPDLDLLDRIYAEDVVVHDAGAPEDIVGLEALKAFYRESHAGFPDFTVRIDETLTAGDRVIFLWTIEGTQTGDLRGLPATGLTVSVSGVAMDRLEEGRIVEEWV